MADYNLFLPILMENEGYYVSAERAEFIHDSGGETWRGISRNNFPHWMGWSIIDSYKDKSNFPKSLRADTDLQDLVNAFYKPTFWDVIQGDNINNQSIANFMADWGVNAGPSVPIKHAQEILGLAQDGKFGPKTLAAINLVNGLDFFRKLQASRKQFYLDIVTAHPEKGGNLYNWLDRNASFQYIA